MAIFHSPNDCYTFNIYFNRFTFTKINIGENLQNWHLYIILNWDCSNAAIISIISALVFGLDYLIDLGGLAQEGSEILGQAKDLTANTATSLELASNPFFVSLVSVQHQQSL